jgi:hypothetical protein
VQQPRVGCSVHADLRRCIDASVDFGEETALRFLLRFGLTATVASYAHFIDCQQIPTWLF